MIRAAEVHRRHPGRYHVGRPVHRGDCQRALKVPRDLYGQVQWRQPEPVLQLLSIREPQGLLEEAVDGEYCHERAVEAFERAGMPVGVAA